MSVNENISFQTGTTPTLTIGAGATLTPGAANVISGAAGTLTGSGTAKVTRTAATADFNTQYSIGTKTLTNLTVDYDAAGAQTVNALNYFSLTIQGARGANSVTLESGSVGVSGVFNPTASYTSGGYVVTGNTVDFNGGGAQTVPAFGYNNLMFSNAGVKTLTSGTTGILGAFTIGGTATVDATSNNTTVDFNGAGSQTVLAINYNHLTLSTSGTKTFSTGVTGIAGDFLLTGAAAADATTNTTDIDFNGSAGQSVAAIDYDDLIFSNAGTKTFAAGTTRIAATFTISGSASADAVTNSTTIEYTGSANQNSPVMTYYNLVVNRVSLTGRLLVNDVTVNNDFTILVGEARVANAFFTVVGQTSISGLFRVSNANAIPSFGDIVVNTAGEIRFAANAVMTLNGNLQVDGSAIIASGTNTWTFQKSGGGVLSGTATGVPITNASFTTDYTNTGDFSFGTVNVSASTLTNNSVLAVTTALTGSGTLTQGSGASLDIGFVGALGLSTLNASAAGNTVSYSAAGAQSVLPINYANLMLAGSGVKSFAGGVTGVNGGLTFGGSATADAVTNISVIDYNGGGAQAIGVLDYFDLTLSNAGTKSFANGTTRIAGTLDIAGAAAADATTNTPTLELNGTGIQTVEGLSAYNVTMNNSSGIVLSGPLTVTNLLTLTSGAISTGPNNVTIASTGTVSRASGHIIGNLIKDIPTGTPARTFEIGDASVYAPVSLAFTGGVSSAGTFTASTTMGDHPQILTSTVDASKSVNRYWTITNNGAVFTSYDAVFTFDAADVDGGANTASFILDRYNGGTWTPPAVGTLTATSSQALGVTADGDFQIGELSLAVLKTWDGGAATSNWGDANNWNPDGVPTSLNNVSLTGANTINVNVAASANSITLNNSSLLVTILSGNSLTVAGDFIMADGTVNTEAAFPSVAGTVSISGGTTGYVASGAQSVATIGYHHLNLAGSGTKTFGSGTTMVTGDLTIGGTAIADATTNSTTIAYNGGAQLVGAVNYHNLTLSNAGTKTFAAGVTGIANALSITGTASADATSNSTTIDYNGSGAQLVGAVSYHNLTLSNAGTKTFATGTVGIANTLTITGTASADATSNGTTVDYNGGGSQSVQALNYHHLSLSNAGTKTFAAGTFGMAGNFSVTGSALADATTNATTVDYNGSGAQSIGGINYHHLTLSGSGTKTFLSGTTGIAGVLSIGGLAAADATSNATTIDYNGSGAQSIAQFDYNNLSLSNAGAKQLAAGTTNISGNITAGGSATLDASTNTTLVNLNGAGAQMLPAADYSSLTFANAGVKTLGSGTTRVSGVFSISGSAVADLTTNTTTFEFTGAGNQDSPEITYHNLIASNTGTRLLLNNVVVNNDFTVQIGQARVTNQNFSVSGLTTLNSEFRITAIAGVKSLSSVLVNTSGFLNLTAGEDLAINGDLTVNGGGNIASNSGVWTFQKPGGGTIAGTSPSVTITNAAMTTPYVNSGVYAFADLAVTATTFTNNGTVTMTNAITGTGEFAQGAAGTLNYNSTTSMTVSTFTASATGNTVVYGASGVQDIVVADYSNLTLAGSNAKTFGSGTTRIAGAFDVTGGATADALSNNPTLEFNGSIAQAVEGLSYYRVTINNAAGISLTGTMTVTDLLTLTDGTIGTGSNSVIIASGGTVSRTSGHVVGNLVKTVLTGSPTLGFEVGDGSGNYSPVTAAFVSVTVSDILTVSTTSGDHSEILTSGLEPSKTVNRYWTLSGSGISYANYNATFNFVGGDVDGAANTANFIIGRYESAAWNLPTVGTLTPTSSQATGVVGFGDFQIGEQSTAVLKTWDGGAATNNWGDDNNWNPNGVPGVTNNVNLTGANTIDIDVAASVNSITLNNSSLVLTILSGNSLTIAGDYLQASGMLDVESTFPSVTGTVTISGGTVGYTASGDQDVALQSYNHLSLSGTGTKTFGAGTTSIAGDLTISGGAAADATTNSGTVDYNGGGSQAVGATDYYNLTFSNAGVKTLAAGSIGVANTFSITGSATADAVTNSATVDYNGAGNQSVRGLGYHHLTLSNAGTKTFDSGTTGIAGNLTISGSAAADAISNSTTIDFDGSAGQTVGAVDYHHLSLSNAGTKVFASGTTRVAGNLTVAGSAAGDAAANSTTVEFNGSSAQTVAAMAFHHLTASNGSSKILGAGTTTIAGNLMVTGGASIDAMANNVTVDFNGTNQIIPVVDFYAVTFSNSGTKTLSAGTTRIASNLNITGTAALDAVTNSTTVEFNGTVIQSSSAATFYNLSIVKVSGRLNLDNLTVTNDFSIQSGEGRLSAGSFAVGGTTTISEIFRISSTAGTLVLGDIVVNSPGQVIFGANEDVTVNGSLQVDGSASFSGGTGLWTFQAAGGGTLSGTAALLTIANSEFTTAYAVDRNMTFGTLTITGTTMTNNQTIVVTGSLAGTGAITQGAGSSLSLDFGGTVGLAALNAAAAGNTVQYVFAGAQVVFPSDYVHLTLGTSGIKTLAAGTTGVAGMLTVSGTATVDATTNSSTVNYNGSGNQDLNALAFHHLTLSLSGMKIFPAGITSIAGDLTISGSAAADVVTNSSGIFFVGAVSQSVPSMTYHDLSLSGAGTKTTEGTITVVNDFTNSGVFDMLTFDLSISGSGTSSGTMRFGGETNGLVFAGGTVEYNGTSVQAPGGQSVALGTYNDLLFTNDALKRIAGGTVHTQSGLVIGGTVTLIVDGDGVLEVEGDLENSGNLTNNGLITVGN
ncbi:MAG: hypothetical protein WEB62_01295 [Bacteroidota bacterium]